MREGLLAVLAGLPDSSAVAAGDLAAMLAWRLPSADTSAARVAAVLAETERLGLTAGGALSELARGLAAGHAEQAARAVFPAAASTVVLQADLTAVAGGPVSAKTAAILDGLAERVGQGRWRFSRESVRRALDDGASGDEVLAALRQVAPTVAVGRDPAAVVLDALRRAGYAPVPDPAPNAGNADDPVITVRRAPGPRPAAVTAVTADGFVETIDLDASRVDPSRLAARLYTAPVPNQQRVQALIDRLRDADSGLGFARLPDEEVRLLAEAAVPGTAVWIKYESAFSTSGKGSWRLLDELHIEPRQVVAWCCTRQKQKTYPQYSIKSVEPA